MRIKIDELEEQLHNAHSTVCFVQVLLPEIINEHGFLNPKEIKVIKQKIDKIINRLTDFWYKVMLEYTSQEKEKNYLEIDNIRIQEYDSTFDSLMEIIETLAFGIPENRIDPKDPFSEWIQ